MILERSSSGALLIRTLGAALPERRAVCRACGRPTAGLTCLRCQENFMAADREGWWEGRRERHRLALNDRRPRGKARWI